jgi:beta-glucuronidase
MLPDETQPDRAQISLSGNWSFQADRKNEGESAGWFADEHDMKSWRGVDVPVAFDNCGPDMNRYAGAGWFRKQVHVPESFRGKRVVLSFEGINYNAKVWVNGKPVGENHDAFLPFTLPINDTVKIGAENKITVRVDNLRTRGQFPLFEGWCGQGGFTREACVVATDETYLLQTFIEAEPAAGGGQLRLRAAVANGADRAMPLKMRVRVLDSKGGELTTLQSAVSSFAPGQGGKLSVEGIVPDAQAWSPDSPALYTAHVTLLSDGKPLDALTRRVGFRRVEVKEAKVILNGQPVFLKGFNRHEDSPRTGMAVDLAQAGMDFIAMKKMGCNYVRLCHYPHHPGELDLCDELGIMVLAESAMNEWGHVDHPDPNGGFALAPEDAPLIMENARRTLRKMVQRDNHHPSIILWSISNENAEERSDVAEGNGELLRYGKTLDRSRPWTHVSNCHQKPGWESFYRFDDVIVVNVYPSHQPQVERTAATLAAGLPEATKYMENVLAKLHQQFPAKPIVIGEFGYLDGESGPESARLQTIATEAEIKGLNAAYVAGCALWVYARHPWANQASYAGGKSIISPYGYVSHDRKTRFPALSVVERLFKQRAGITNNPEEAKK